MKIVYVCIFTAKYKAIIIQFVFYAVRQTERANIMVNISNMDKVDVLQTLFSAEPTLLISEKLQPYPTLYILNISYTHSITNLVVVHMLLYIVGGHVGENQGAQEEKPTRRGPVLQ